MCPDNHLLAYELWLKQNSLSNADIKALFGVRSSATVCKIKAPILSLMAEKEMFLPRGRLHLVTAYEAWGLEEHDLERRYTKAKKFSLLKEVTS